MLLLDAPPLDRQDSRHGDGQRAAHHAQHRVRAAAHARAARCEVEEFRDAADSRLGRDVAIKEVAHPADDLLGVGTPDAVTNAVERVELHRHADLLRPRNDSQRVAVGDALIDSAVHDQHRRLTCVYQRRVRAAGDIDNRRNVRRVAGVAAVARIAGVVPDTKRSDGARGVAADADAVGVDALGGGVGAEPADGGLGVVLGVEDGEGQLGIALLEVVARTQAIVDGGSDVAAPGKASCDCRVQGIGLVAAREAAAMDPDEGGPRWLRVTRRLVEVEAQRDGVGVLVGRLAVSGVCRDGDGGEDLVAIALLLGDGGRLRRERGDEYDGEYQEGGLGAR